MKKNNEEFVEKNENNCHIIINNNKEVITDKIEI